MNTEPPETLDKKAVAQSFNLAAATYQKVAQFQRAVGAMLLERVVALDIQPSVIVDVGAGSGDLVDLLGRRYREASVYAVDLAFQLLQRGRYSNGSFLSFFQRSNRFGVCADAAQLPLADNSVDLLVSNLMLQWCSDLRGVFGEWARVLKPEGVLLFSTLGPDTLKELRDSWSHVDQSSHVIVFVDMHDVGDLLWQLGFVNPVMDVDWSVRWYGDVLALVRELKALGAHNVTAGRARGLTGKGKWQAMTQRYELFRQAQGLPATYEVVYGYASGKKSVESQSKMNVTSIPITQIGRRGK